MKYYLIIFFLIVTIRLNCQGWQSIGLDSLIVRQVYVLGDTIWAGTEASNLHSQTTGLYRSINNGTDWVQIDTALGDGGIVSLSINPKNQNEIYLVKGSSPYAVVGTLYKSTDGGIDWNKVILRNDDAPDYGIKWVSISSFDYKKIYALDSYHVAIPILLDINHVYKSMDSGSKWQLISPTGGSYVAFNFSQKKDSILFAVTETPYNKALYKSSNDGYSWQEISTPPIIPKEIISDDELDCRIYLQSYFITDDCGIN